MTRLNVHWCVKKFCGKCAFYDHFKRKFYCPRCNQYMTTEEIKAFNEVNYVPKERKKRGKNKRWYEV